MRMVFMRAFIDAWRKKFDDRKYSRKFYSDTLNKISQAKNSTELGKHIIHFLHWKDGKLFEDRN